ncbi:MAG TPA: serine protease [Chitinophagaceae bacterium]|nr:serine protease [Chitinophagaceae bacterium]
MILTHRYASYLSLLLVAASGLLPACQTQGQRVLSAEENYARNRPGVVKVQTEFSANVYVNKVIINEGRFDLLVDSVRRLDTSGLLLSPEKKLDIVLNALYTRPLRYFAPTTEYLKQAHRVVSTGTGFFVSGDGNLVTNCHVIDRDSTFIRKEFILSTFQEVTESNINSLESSWEMKLTPEQRNLLYNTYVFIYSRLSTMILFNLQKQIFIEFKAARDTGSQSVVTLPARVIRQGRPMPGKDVAILKIDGQENLPALSLSTEPSVNVGSQIYVFGYPGYVASNRYLAPDAVIEPTLTTGIVSSIKRSIGGWPVIQTDATISYGSSGGPVCDRYGQVIGLATFGSLGQGSGELASGYNFAIPVSIIREYLDSVKLKPSLSQASLSFNQGLKWYFSGYYRRALGEFEKVLKLNSSYPQLYQYIRNARQKVENGQDRQHRIVQTFLIIMILILAVSAALIRIRRTGISQPGSVRPAN